ncbi:MAG: hypothetical protein OEZ68_12545 [Gammaproteobacteria bacterium]|nr:hypothetical protein [Gammaproteobacteria bacterium]MDH5801625.1 hypothetical protein [Gammaproteobacteria bacterium]
MRFLRLMRWNDKLTNKRVKTFIGALLTIPVLVVNTTAVGVETDAAKTEEFFGIIDLSENKVVTEAKKKETGVTAGESWSIKGYVKQRYAYSLEQPVSASTRRESEGLSQVRTVFDVSLEGKLYNTLEYRLNGYRSEDNYATWDDGFEWREAYINFPVGNRLWLKTGRQIVAWGQSDFTQILDQTNPRDVREFGLVEAEDIRIPVAATKLNFVGNRWGVDLVFTHEYRSNRMAAQGDDFDPYVVLRGNFYIDDGREPELDDPEILFRSFFSFSKGDISFIYADVYDDSPVLRITGPGQMQRYYNPIKVAGVGANWIENQWLFKTELAYKKDVEILRNNFAGGRVTETGAKWVAMLGAEYTINGDAGLALEYLMEQIQDYSIQMRPEESETSFILSGRFEYLRDLATLTLAWGHWEEGKSDIYRVTFDYDVADNLELSAGYLVYQAEEPGSLLYSFRNNDQFSVGLRMGLQ